MLTSYCNRYFVQLYFLHTFLCKKLTFKLTSRDIVVTPPSEKLVSRDIALLGPRYERGQ